MITVVQNPLVAAPSLSAAIAKIRRTPLSRLLIGYRVLSVRRSLGAELRLQRLIAGGNQGEALPLGALRAKVNCDPLVGQQIDFLA
jgi:hypothetical protein